VLDEVPVGETERRAWLRQTWAPRSSALAHRFRDLLLQLYGPKRGAQVRYAEAFEVCEYGAPLTEGARERLFPFPGLGVRAGP
jgi:hypothetical protein